MTRWQPFFRKSTDSSKLWWHGGRRWESAVISGGGDEGKSWINSSQEGVIQTCIPKKWHLLVITYPGFFGECLKFQMFQSTVLAKSSEFQNIYAKITVPRCLSHTTVPQNLLPENVSCFIYLFILKSQPTRKSKPRQKVRVALFDSSMGTRLFARQMAQSWKMGVMLYSQ